LDDFACVTQQFDRLKKRPQIPAALRFIGVVEEKVSNILPHPPKLRKDTLSNQELWVYFVQLRIGRSVWPQKASCVCPLNMDRITEMKSCELTSRSIFKEIGTVRWQFDAFAVRTERGATMLLSPNSDALPSVVHIDEIRVPQGMRRRGIASEALAMLCRLADKYQFRLEGGPVGWSDSPQSDKFVAWLRKFGFTQDPDLPAGYADDPAIFNVRRRQRHRHSLELAEPISL
jgi:hypothetical protein